MRELSIYLLVMPVMLLMIYFAMHSVKETNTRYNNIVERINTK